MVTYVFLIYATVLIAVFKSLAAGVEDGPAAKCIEDTQAMAASTGVRYPRLVSNP